MTRFPTYQAVWSWERRIYRIEQIRLPMPVTFRWLGAVLGALVVTIPLNSLLDPLLPWAPVRYVLLPILLANWLTKAKLDGKPPLAWVTGVVAYLFVPKRWTVHGPVKRQGRVKFTVRVLARR